MLRDEIETLGSRERKETVIEIRLNFINAEAFISMFFRADPLRNSLQMQFLKEIFASKTNATVHRASLTQAHNSSNRLPCNHFWLTKNNPKELHYMFPQDFQVEGSLKMAVQSASTLHDLDLLCLMANRYCTAPLPRRTLRFRLPSTFPSASTTASDHSATSSPRGTVCFARTSRSKHKQVLHLSKFGKRATWFTRF